MFWIYLLPVLLLCMVTLPHLDQGDFRAETGHYAAVGVQAWRDYALFWTPHEHPSVRYFNKPPLVFWIHGLILHLFGISLAAARIPTIFAAVGCVLFTVAITRRLMGRMTALAAGCALALTYEFFRRTREISLDMWQLFFMMAAVWLTVAAARSPRRNWIFLAGIPLGLALMCKPLMALLVPCIFLIWKTMEAALAPVRLRDFALLLIALLLVALPWHLSMTYLHGNAFTSQYFGHEVIARMQGQRNCEPIWYYAVEMGRTYWPWGLFFLAGVLHWRRTTLSARHRAALRAAMIWIATWAVAITAFPDKRPRYELPLYPMLAMVAGYGWVTLPWHGLKRWYRHRMATTAMLVVAVGVTVSLLPITFQSPPAKDLTALIQWAQRQNPSTIYSAAMTATDESVLYLRTGSWPTPARPPFHPEAGSLLIYTAGMQPEPGRNANVAFSQGLYRVIRK